MFEKKHRWRILGFGLVATGVLACQNQQQQPAAKPIEFSSAGFEGIEIGKLALLTAECNPNTNPVVITVGDNEFAYLYLRPADGQVVANANATGGGECAFDKTKRITIDNHAGTGSHNRKVLVDFLNGQFAQGADGTTGLEAGGIGITIDLGDDAGPNDSHSVMFRGSVQSDLFTFGTAGGISYGAYAKAASPPVTPTAHADFSFVGVSDILVSTGPSDDVITGQGSTTNPIMAAITGDISLNFYGGDGNDRITSGAAGRGTNSLNGNAGSDIFYQVPGVYAHDVISGGVDPTTTVTNTDSTTSTGTGTKTTTTTSTGTGTDTKTITTSSLGTGTDTMTTTKVGTGTGSGTGTKTITTSSTGTGTVTTHLTATGTSTSTGTSTATHTRTSTTSSTGTDTATTTKTTTTSATDTTTTTKTTSSTGTDTGTTTKTTVNIDAGTGTKTVVNTDTSTSTATLGDVSIDVVDYSDYDHAVTVTLGDQDFAATASASIICVDSNMINDYDGFTVNDGSTTKYVEYHKAGNHAMGTITAPAAGAAAISNADTLTVDDGSHAVTFMIKGGTGTFTATATDTALIIDVTDANDANAAAKAIAAGIVNYQMVHRGNTAVGTATMTNTSIIPNVTVTPPAGTNTLTDITIGLQDRNAVTPTLFVATTSTGGITVDNPAAAPLQNAHADADTLPVTVDNANSDEKTVADLTAAAISGLAVVTTSAFNTVTIAANASGVKAGYAITKFGGAFAITNVVAGAVKPLGNDGYAGASERDSIYDDVEMVIGTAFDDTIDATHAGTNQHIFYGMDGNDTLIIGAQSTKSNILYGGRGNDHLLGGSGKDWLYGGEGNDWLAGGLGNDVIDGDGANCVVASTGVYASDLCTSDTAPFSNSAQPGVNVLDYSDRTAKVIVDLGNLTNPANLQIGQMVGETPERDTVTNCKHLQGGSGNDILTGDDGDNMIWGGPGDDTIDGKGGDDTLKGDMGNDIISGGAGNDFIYGGAGINQLWGDSATDPTVMGYNMLDNSEGKQGYVDCGPADTMNIFFPNGGEDPSNVIHCGMTVKPTQ
jgi:hypothetical protein